MERIHIDDVEPSGYGRDIDRRPLSKALGTTDVAINVLRLESGERLSGSIHTHLDQEEVFVVLDGECTFDRPDGEVTLGPNEVIRFAPGEYQSGYNTGTERARILALGAPRETESIRIYAECADCGHEGLRPIERDGEEALECPECGWTRQ